MKINELVYKKRRELKEDQSTFGKRFGISHAAISDIERGVTTSLSFEMIEFIFREMMPPDEDKRIRVLEEKVEKLMFLAGFRKETENSACPRCGSDSIMHVQNH